MDFLRENRSVCSTALTERQPLKRGRQISQHLLIHPNLRFIIVPQPCRKRSVTLGDCPATHLSNFTLLSSHPFYGRLHASSRLGGNICLFGISSRKSICLPLFSQIMLRAEEKGSLFFFCVPVFSPCGYDSIHVKHVVITTSPMQGAYVEDK